MNKDEIYLEWERKPWLIELRLEIVKKRQMLLGRYDKELKELKELTYPGNGAKNEINLTKRESQIYQQWEGEEYDYCTKYLNIVNEKEKCIKRMREEYHWLV